MHSKDNTIRLLVSKEGAPKNALVDTRATVLSVQIQTHSQQAPKHWSDSGCEGISCTVLSECGVYTTLLMFAWHADTTWAPQTYF
jgi:hypothetical protein